ncbi:prenyltransferase and squalene oxidase repeat protein [Aspergillus ustus]|uniref:Terpene cyclase/mutase family member n=1 Tax=Aspergillus ustus TaxID=40382 RepID=A0A0C1C3U2_ASPUT|nr:prenyltransferase and squalene oxidase repeat protein [Aspergillus ustus]
MSTLTEKPHPANEVQSNPSLTSQAQTAIDKATAYAWSIFSNNHWCGELESNVTVTCEHIFFLYILYQRIDPAEGNQYTKWLLSQQNTDGSWGIAPNHPGDVSTSAEAYLALKILGLPIDGRELSAARRFILSQGGLSKMRMFTRIFFAEFGLVSWTQIPQLPAEFILVPASFPITIYKLASWARSNVVPLLIIAHHRPLYALPNGQHTQNPYLDELWLDPDNKALPYGSSNPLDPIQFLFTIMDKALSYLGGLRLSPTRSLARRRCISWILSHQEKAGDWAGIIPPMHAGIKALLLEGHSIHSDPIQRGLAAIERFTWTDTRGKRLQCCISPVWDTVLMIRALRDCRIVDPRINDAVAWTAGNQHSGPEGDWRVYRPGIPVGGFAFEYQNTWYPDIDDTAAAVLAFLTQHDDESTAGGVARASAARSETVRRAVLWIIGMQNSDGGWAAFDHENNHLFLNKIPFSDMDSLCDPSTPDVTGRVIECLGMLRGILLDTTHTKPGEKSTLYENKADEYMLRTITLSIQKALPYLIATQEETGAWYGRWAVNYIYGTCLVLCGLQYFVNNPEYANVYPQLPGIMAKAARWLSTIQNSDGGWGESLLSYREPWRAGCGASTPSQTAWALMGLLSVPGAGGVESRAVKRGVEYLVRTQDDVLDDSSEGTAAVWTERQFTSTGFPNHFYISYTLYRVFFPITALGRFVQLANEEERKKMMSRKRRDSKMDVEHVEV